MAERILCKAFDALPQMVFVVDGDVRLSEYNKAAEPLMGPAPELVLKNRLGDILHCLNSLGHGCGNDELCGSCVIRNSVKKSLSGEPVWRTRRKLEIEQNGETVTLYTLITAVPFDDDKSILTVENFEELSELGELITKCSVCGDVLHDDDNWHALETFLERKWGMEFSHGLCPACYKTEMTKYGG